MSALSYKAKENAVYVIEDIEMDAPKTKTMMGVLESLNIADKKTLMVLPEYQDNLYLSARNIPNLGSRLLSDINTYELMNADVLLLLENTAKILTEEVAA
jgi:large subunit ribosomal protein L4